MITLSFATLQHELRATYRLEHELGGAEMSRVFAAEELAFGRRVALKVLPPERAGELSLERFSRELLTAARLQQANILPVLSAGDLDGVPWYAMPFIEGRSLRDRLTEAADAAWTRGGALGVTLTSVGLAIGSAAYMAPEQALGDETINGRADLYSLGCVLYVAFTGRLLFSAVTPQSQLAAHLSQAPAHVGTLHRDLPSPLPAYRWWSVWASSGARRVARCAHPRWSPGRWLTSRCRRRRS